MPDEKKRVTTLDKLRKVVADRVADEDIIELKRDPLNALNKRDRMDKPMRRTFVDECLKEGGKNRHLIAPAESLQGRPERIGYIAELMASGQWRTPLCLVLAKVWNLSPISIRTMSSEASRTVRMTLGSKDQLRNTAMAFLEEIAHDAKENGDRRSAVTAIRTFAEIAGLLVNRHEVTGADGGPIKIVQELRAMSDDELDREIIRKAAEVIGQGGGGDLADQAGKLLQAANVITEAEFEETAD